MNNTTATKAAFFRLSMPLFLVLFIDGLGLALIFPILVTLVLTPGTSILPYNTDLFWRDFDYGALIGIYFLCWFFGTTLISDWSDQVGRKKALLVCLTGTFLGYVFSALAVVSHTIWLLFLGRIVDGFTTGSQPVAQATIIDLSTEENKARNLSAIIATMSVGFILGPLVGSYLSDPKLITWFSPTTPLYFAALLSFSNVLLLLVLFKDTSHHQIQSKSFIKPLRAIDILVDAFRNKNIRYLSFIYMIYQIAWSNFFSFISVYLNQIRNFSTVKIGNYFFLIGIGFVAGSVFVVNRMVKHFQLKYSAIISGFLSAIFIITTITISANWSVWVSSVFISLWSMVVYATILNLFSNQVGSDTQGRIMGITDALKAAMFGIFGMLSGWIATINAILPMFFAIIGLLLTAFLLFFFKPKPIKK